MNIREALLTMSPSLVLQRAASDEIARLDAKLIELNEMREAFASQARYLAKLPQRSL